MGCDFTYSINYGSEDKIYDVSRHNCYLGQIITEDTVLYNELYDILTKILSDLKVNCHFDKREIAEALKVLSLVFSEMNEGDKVIMDYY